MIFVWLRTALFYFMRLFFAPLPPKWIPIDENEMCPACGHQHGKLTAETWRDGSLHVRHDCLTCKATWFSAPVLGVTEPIAASSATVRVTAPAPAKE